MSHEQSHARMGKPHNRVDGRLKVTGGARYAAEFPINNVAHGVFVMSTIAKGRIARINTQTAERAPGVLAVITHLNAPKLPFREPKVRADVDPKVGRYLHVLQSDIVHFDGQLIGVVIAETLEQAEHAAALVQVTYAKEKHSTRVEDEMARAFPPQEANEKQKFLMHSFGAHFVEVRVDLEFGQVHVVRVVGAYGCGRVINPKTARSQAVGGTVGGIGMALMEETHMDQRYGRYVNANLGEYHMPVNADVVVIEPYFVDEYDPHANPLGAKGLGEIAIVGVAAAIANAVYHATGKRIRDLPITPDKLL